VQSKSPAPISTDPSLAAVLAALSLALLGCFLVAVVFGAWPANHQDPQWQLGLIADLISKAPLALLGALLTPLALTFHPGNDSLRARRDAFRKWALAASIGFLLLIPLQIYAGWKLYRTSSSKAEQEISKYSIKLGELRQTIASVSSSQEIQAKLQQLAGNNAGLTPTQQRGQIDQLRKELLILDGAEQAGNFLEQRIEAAQASFNPDRLYKETLISTLSALSYGTAFAFLAGALPRVRVQRGLAYGWSSIKRK